MNLGDWTGLPKEWVDREEFLGSKEEAPNEAEHETLRREKEEWGRAHDVRKSTKDQCELTSVTGGPWVRRAGLRCR